MADLRKVIEELEWRVKAARSDEVVLWGITGSAPVAVLPEPLLIDLPEFAALLSAARRGLQRCDGCQGWLPIKPTETRAFCPKLRAVTSAGALCEEFEEKEIAAP